MKDWKSLAENGRELKDSLYLILLQGVNQFLPVLLIPYLMYTLGAAGYGYVGFAFSVIQVVTLVVDFGFDLSATKHVAQVVADAGACSRVFWNVLAAKVFLLLVAAFLLFLTLLCVPAVSLYASAVWATFPMAVGSVFSCMWFFQGVGKVRIYSVMNTVSKLILLPLVFVFVKSPDDYVWAALLQSLVFVSTAIVTLVYIWRNGMVGWCKPCWRGMCEEMRQSYPLFLSKASTSVYTQLFVVILGFFCAADAIGRYTSAERIMRAVCFFLIVPVNQSFFPKVSRLAATDRAGAMKVFRLVWIVVAVAMFIVFFMLFFGGSYLPAFFGEDYRGIETLLRIFALAPPAIGVGSVYGQMGLVAMGGHEARIRFRNVYFIVAVFALATVAVLAPLWGTDGAAWTIVASEWLVCGLMCYYFHREVRACC